MSSYRDLRVWQESMQLAKAVYQAVEQYPRHELYGLTSQSRRAAVSVASNIAEGKGRRTDRDFVSFLYRARGSLLELETQLSLAGELQYLNEGNLSALLKRTASVGGMLTGLINSLSAEEGRRPTTEDRRHV